jgi:hypothetical protein
MNNIRQLIDILEDISSEPEIGDYVELEVGDTLVETYIEDITEDGVVIKLDETALGMIIDACKQYIAEDKLRGEEFMDRADELHAKIMAARNSGNKEIAAKLQQEYDDLHDEAKKGLLPEAEYQGRKVSLGKPFLTPDGPKKRSVYVKNKKGNVVKVNFGQKGVKIKKNNPGRRKNFRARHNCSTAKDRTTARYWSCKFW